MAYRGVRVMRRQQKRWLGVIDLSAARSAQTLSPGQSKGITRLIDIILALLDLSGIEEAPNIRLLANHAMAFRENNELVARDAVLLDCLSDDLLAHTVRVDVRRVPCVQASIVRSFEEG